MVNAMAKKINFVKSAVFFSNNTKEMKKTKIKDMFGIQAITNQEKSLGLPTMVGPGLKHAFRELKNRINATINAWNMRALSHGGKEVLFKALIQAIPTYIMSCFFLRYYQ